MHFNRNYRTARARFDVLLEFLFENWFSPNMVWKLHDIWYWIISREIIALIVKSSHLFVSCGLTLGSTWSERPIWLDQANQTAEIDRTKYVQASDCTRKIDRQSIDYSASGLNDNACLMSCVYRSNNHGIDSFCSQWFNTLPADNQNSNENVTAIFSIQNKCCNECIEA